MASKGRASNLQAQLLSLAILTPLLFVTTKQNHRKDVREEKKTQRPSVSLQKRLKIQPPFSPLFLLSACSTQSVKPSLKDLGVKSLRVS